jgi:hypothetical protein
MYLGVRVEAPLVSRKNSFGCVEFSAKMRTVKKINHWIILKIPY